MEMQVTIGNIHGLKLQQMLDSWLQVLESEIAHVMWAFNNATGDKASEAECSFICSLKCYNKKF
jgi:hypothetical protein